MTEEEPKFMVWPYIMHKESWDNLQKVLECHRVKMSLTAFPNLTAIVVKAQCVLTLKRCVIVQLLISHFDDGKDPVNG